MFESASRFAAVATCVVSLAGCQRGAVAERTMVGAPAPSEQAPANPTSARGDDNVLGCLAHPPSEFSMTNEFGAPVPLGTPSWHLSNEGDRRAKNATARDGDYGFFEGRADQDDPTVTALQFGHYRDGAWHPLALLEEYTSGAGTRYGWLASARLERTSRPDGSDLVIIEYQRDLADFDRYEYTESAWWRHLYITERPDEPPTLLFELPVRDAHRYLNVKETDNGPATGQLISARSGQQHVRLGPDGCARRVATSDLHVVCTASAMPAGEDWADRRELDELCAGGTPIAWSERGQPRRGTCQQAPALPVGTVVLVSGALYQRDSDGWVHVSEEQPRDGEGQAVEILSAATGDSTPDVPVRWKHGYRTDDDGAPRWIEATYQSQCYPLADRLDCSQRVVTEWRTYEFAPRRLLGVTRYDVRRLDDDCLAARLVEDTHNTPWPTDRPLY